ncbi:MAG: cytidine deaminase [Armatimonadetes bacterium]|nr:cytidine deaminase [Armatimonadota bacterium]
MNPELISLATHARSNAYCPYSGYAVGCALLTSKGQTFVGCNFENLSYGACICAERGAIGAMIVAGDREISELTVVTCDGGTPCGMCLQVIHEFAGPDLRINCVDPQGKGRTYNLRELFPFAFHSDKVGKNN